MINLTHEDVGKTLLIRTAEDWWYRLRLDEIAEGKYDLYCEDCDDAEYIGRYFLSTYDQSLVDMNSYLNSHLRQGSFTECTLSTQI